MTANAQRPPSPDHIREPEVTPELGAEHGLKAQEYKHIIRILNRAPTYTELGIFSVMWSEHCSYKSSRLHLKKLPTDAPWVIQGPGENAGVIDIGDGQAAIFKMESHNHPSFIEPYQGAATGVGGIMRDVFTMGARPIANLNALRFGAMNHPKTPHLVGGVVAGIAGYGNCMGVPTVGGETNFDPGYNGNILVNAMTVGLADTDRIFYARGAEPDQPVVYVGSKTGRDGIHGATMASAEFDDNAEQQRPTVQAGDPFTEKLLLEACLELMQEDAIISIQDMGAAGLTSSSVEIAAKGGIGVEIDLDKVPQRETLMTPYELMLSESQERMLMILKPGREDFARRIFEKWDLDFSVIGRTTVARRLVIHMYGQCWCDIPVMPLVDDSPVYDRPHEPTPAATAINNADYPLPEGGIPAVLKTLVACPDLCSKRWIWEQYDSLVMGETYFSPGITGPQAPRTGDSALVRIAGYDKGLALTSDCTPRYCQADPASGGKQAVAESYRNICAVGARPLAFTNNLNFGNPEKPLIMGQFVGCLEGMAEAGRALEYPVVSGNVSLYNETNGQAIPPTPVIGGVGVIDHADKAMDIAFKAADECLLLVGPKGAHLGSSLYLRDVIGKTAGGAPHVDLALEAKHGAFMRMLIDRGLVTACHDLSDGGLAVALAEMAMAGRMGAKITIDDHDDPAGFWFGEDQGRYLVCAQQPDIVTALAAESGIDVWQIGHTAPDTLTFPGGAQIAVQELIEAHEKTLPDSLA